jgi:oxidoreductase
VRTAVVLGATGATGEHVVTELLSRPHLFERVRTVGRREATVASLGPSVELSRAADATRVLRAAQQGGGRLTHFIVNADALEDASPFEGADAVFCCIGTTRRDAGSDEAFRSVDLHAVSRLARLARAAGVRHFALVSSVGASPTSWFLYPRTKGEAEEAVKAMGFESVSVFRPGLLGRGDKTRLIEKVAGWVSPVLQVSDLARSMVLDAARRIAAKDKGPTLLDNSAIYASIRAGEPVVPSAGGASAGAAASRQ